MTLSLKTNQGFSIIEAMIVLVVLGIGSLAMMQLTISQTAMQKSVRLTSDLQGVVQEVGWALSNPNVCQFNLTIANNLSALTFDRTQLNSSATFPDIFVNQLTVPSSSSPIIQSGHPVTPSDIGTAVQISLVGLKEVVTDQSYVGTLRFSLNMGKGAGGANNIFRDLPISLRTSASGNTETILGCVTGATNVNGADVAALVESICVSAGGTYLQSTKTCTPGGASSQDVGKWSLAYQATANNDPSVPECSDSFKNFVSTAIQPLSVSGGCGKIGGKCRMTYPTTSVLATCHNDFTQGAPPDGGGGDGGGSDGSDGGDG